MIRIKVDPYGLTEDDPMALVVRDESQFIESRLKIRVTLHKRKDLTVIIKNRKVGQWYKSLRDYLEVKIETVSPSSVLLQELNLSASLSLNLPVSDQEIQELRLIEKAKKYPPQTRLATTREIENWVLSVCVGECYGEKGGTLTHLAETASFFLRGKKNQRHSALERLMDKQKEEWFNSPLGKAYKWLFIDPRDKAFLVYTWHILKNYDTNMRERILDELTKNNRKVLEPIEKYLDQMPSCECSDDYNKKSELGDLLEIRWKNILRSRFECKKSEIQVKKDEVLKQRFREIIDEVVTKMSGKVAGEINALLAFVRGKTLYFSKELFNLIGAKFSLFPKQIEELSQLIPPKFPSRPMLDWDWNQMSKWVIDEYFPYKKWSIQQGRRDKKIEEIAKTYSEWLYRQYPELKNELSPLIYGTWYRIKRYIEENYQILWLIIDNLCWFYLEDIIRAFKEQSLFRASEPIPCLSMLPSETRISKTALVAGKLPNHVRQEKYQDYSTLFEEFCKTANIPRYRIVPPDKIEKVFKREKIGDQIVTCGMLMNPDISMHKDFYGLEQYMRIFFSSIAEDIKDFISPYPSRQFLLIVSTDHGSCIIPKNIKGLTKPNGSKEESKYKRFVYIDSSDNLNEDWYFLSKDRFSLLESTAITKGYKFIGSRKPKGWVHGGMTPEETLIPHLEFCLQPLKIKPIQCFHSSASIPIGTKKQKVELSIRNLNNYEISKVTLHIPSHSVEMNLEKIPAKDEVVVPIGIALPKEDVIIGKDNTVSLQGFYNFNYLGQPKRGEVEVKIQIRKIIDVSETAEELFKL